MREREVMESVGEMMGSRMFSWNLAVALRTFRNDRVNQAEV